LIAALFVYTLIKDWYNAQILGEWLSHDILVQIAQSCVDRTALRDLLLPEFNTNIGLKSG